MIVWCILCQWLRGWFISIQAGKRYRINTNTCISHKNRRKPKWVGNKLIRFKAIDPNLSSRKLADTFNRQFGDRETVSHTFVWQWLVKHQADVLLCRRQLKRRKPVIGVRNRIWGIDLTGKQVNGKICWIFGGLDHGTRACVSLSVLQDKSTISVLRCILDAMDRFGKPRIIRTDNEPMFTSRLFKFVLWFLGIRHQRTNPACPWQNGRIKRFFGTLKQKLDRIVVHSPSALSRLMQDFRFWYNHIRTHQSLQGYTPAEIWNRRKPKRTAIRYTGWGGLLTGYYHPPDG